MATATIGLVVASLVWAGMVIGIAFLEAPVKFRAPSLTRAVGLDVGQHVFGTLGYVEVGFTLGTAVLLGLTGRSELWLWGALGFVWLLVGMRRLWFWPILRDNARRIIAGDEPPASYHHPLYIGTEMAKVAILIGASLVLLAGIQ